MPFAASDVSSGGRIVPTPGAVNQCCRARCVKDVIPRGMADGVIIGVSLSRGIAHGTAYVLATAAEFASPMLAIAEPDIPSEIDRWNGALSHSPPLLSATQSYVQGQLGDHAVDILVAHV